MFRLARWVFVTADWEIVRVNLRLFMVGRFPADQLWRLWVAGYVVAVTLGRRARRRTSVAMRPVEDGAGDPAPRRRATAGRCRPARRSAPLHRFWPALSGAGRRPRFAETWPPVVGAIGLVVAGLAGGFARHPGAARASGRGPGRSSPPASWSSLQVTIAGEGGVGWDDWGGLHLAVSATVAGIALAFPLGLLLALGRRSSLPALRVVTVGYIEAFRAVPLVTLLFLGQYMVGFLFPNTVEPPSFLVRAVIAITLFEAAYIAEIVRGGLQAVPRGPDRGGAGRGPVAASRSCAWSCCPRRCGR